MLSKKIIPGLFAIFCVQSIHATTSDTVRIFQYNTLNYGDADNPVSYKNPRLSAIISYVQPDIVGTNELSTGASTPQNILTNVLGVDWEEGTYSNTNHEIQANMLFWRTAKFGLVRQTVVCHIVRDIIAFKLYYKDPMLAATHDTTFLTVIVAHLKAGDASADSLTRSSETLMVANYLNTLGAGNYIFMGDLNLYSSNEQAYQNLINNTNLNGRLYDPINRPGNWHNNASFAAIHTQSTRTVALADGGATGGLDDRFDHLIVSKYIMDNTANIQYQAGTYKALGQDGNHLNKAVNASPANSAVPAAMAQALYEMSDHLPVTANFVITRSEVSNSVASISDILCENIAVQNPLHGALHIQFNKKLLGEKLQFSLFTAQGQMVQSWRLRVDAASLEQDVVLNNLIVGTNGFYVLKVSDEKGSVTYKKLLVY